MKKENYVICCYPEGKGPAGLGAQILMGVQTLSHKGIKIDSVNNLFFEYLSPEKINVYENIIDYKPNIFTTNKINYMFCGYPKNISEKDLSVLKAYASKIAVKEEVQTMVASKFAKKQKQKILGVHIRLTDMNSLHANDYGHRGFEDFNIAIERELNTGDYNALFVTSDNFESIEKIKSNYKNIKIIYNDTQNKAKNEEDGNMYNQLIKKNCFNKNQIVESFVDMLCLAECDTVIKRVSSFSLCSIIFSRKKQKVIRI